MHWQMSFYKVKMPSGRKPDGIFLYRAFYCWAGVPQRGQTPFSNLAPHSLQKRAGCTGACIGSCMGGCTEACIGSCMGGCTEACIGSCMGGCTGACIGSCMGGCTGAHAACTGSYAGACVLRWRTATFSSCTSGVANTSPAALPV